MHISMKKMYEFIANTSSKNSYVGNLHKNCHHTAALAALGFYRNKWKNVPTTLLHNTWMMNLILKKFLSPFPVDTLKTHFSFLIAIEQKKSFWKNQKNKVWRKKIFHFFLLSLFGPRYPIQNLHFAFFFVSAIIQCTHKSEREWKERERLAVNVKDGKGKKKVCIFWCVCICRKHFIAVKMVRYTKWKFNLILTFIKISRNILTPSDLLSVQHSSSQIV